MAKCLAWVKGNGIIMLPRSVICEDCGQNAEVRGFGRIEYDWPETAASDPGETTPTITCVRFTIDCPACGVKTQDFFPTGAPAPSHHRAVASTVARDLKRRLRSHRFGQPSPTPR